MTKFFIKNRFMLLFYAWSIVCLSMIFINPYINMVVYIFGVPIVVLAFCYIQDCCRLNKEEEKFLSLFQKIFE